MKNSWIYLKHERPTGDVHLPREVQPFQDTPDQFQAEYVHRRQAPESDDIQSRIRNKLYSDVQCDEHTGQDLMDFMDAEITSAAAHNMNRAVRKMFSSEREAFKSGVDTLNSCAISKILNTVSKGIPEVKMNNSTLEPDARTCGCDLAAHQGTTCETDVDSRKPDRTRLSIAAIEEPQPKRSQEDLDRELAELEQEKELHNSDQCNLEIQRTQQETQLTIVENKHEIKRMIKRISESRSIVSTTRKMCPVKINLEQKELNASKTISKPGHVRKNREPAVQAVSSDEDSSSVADEPVNKLKQKTHSFTDRVTLQKYRNAGFAVDGVSHLHDPESEWNLDGQPLEVRSALSRGSSVGTVGRIQPSKTGSSKSLHQSVTQSQQSSKKAIQNAEHFASANNENSFQPSSVHEMRSVPISGKVNHTKQNLKTTSMSEFRDRSSRRSNNRLLGKISVPDVELYQGKKESSG
jgi:hypothetical protein